MAHNRDIIVHVPDQQAVSGDISVVIPQGGLPVLQQEVFVLANGNLVDLPRGRHVLDHEIGHVVGDLHHLCPSQLLPAPRRERHRTIIPEPSQGASSHQTPAPDPCRILLRRIPILEGAIVQIGKS